MTPKRLRNTKLHQALNNINLFFQGPNSSISDFICKLEAFIGNLEIWINNLENKQNRMFKLLTYLQRQPNEKILEKIKCHLKQLRTELMHYFLAMKRYAYISNPLPGNSSLLLLGAWKQEDIKDIIDIQSNETARTMHKECQPINCLAEHIIHKPEFG